MQGNLAAQQVRRVYLSLTLGNTLAASLIWGINTLFLLDAGLSNLEAFAANAFFTAGMVLFEVPTGVVADTWGRRISYLLGTITLASTTAFYYLLWVIEAPFWGWAVVSVGLGLGFTFFSGAVEAWLVDALKATKYQGNLETVFGQGQIVTGIGMLTGSVAGGVIAQFSNLGVPFVLRALILVAMFFLAATMMRDLGFKPVAHSSALRAMRRVLSASLTHGFKKPPVRWLMLASPFTAGVGIYAFYALQPYLLELYGDNQAYGIAGLAAAIVASSQIIGGYLAPRIRGLFRKRTTALMIGTAIGALSLLSLWLVSNFWLALALIVVWGLLFAATAPIHRAYLNGMIPSKQRATVLSFESLMGNSGGVFIQPALGKSADVWSYGTSFALGGVIQALALPFLFASRAQRSKADSMTDKD